LTQPTEQKVIKAKAPNIEVMGFPPAKSPSLNDKSLSILFLPKLNKS